MSKMDCRDCDLPKTVDDLVKDLSPFLVFNKEEEVQKKTRKPSFKEHPLNVFQILNVWSDDVDAKKLVGKQIYVSKSISKTTKNNMHELKLKVDSYPTLEQMSQWRDYRGGHKTTKKQRWIPIIEDVYNDDSCQEWMDMRPQEWNECMYEPDTSSELNIHDLSLSDADNSMEWTSEADISLESSDNIMEVDY